MTVAPRFGPHTAMRRDALVVALTAVSGATDAFAFSRLGGAFTSVMTGNMVLLGIGIGRLAASTLKNTGAAVLGFILGNVVGARVAGKPHPDDRVWPLPVSAALLVELVLVAIVSAEWWLSGCKPDTDLALSMLFLSAVALGIQSSAVLRLNVSGLSTTYLTGTLTTLVAALTTNRRVRGQGRSLCALIALIGGAAISVVLDRLAPASVPFLPLVLLVGVLVLSSTFREAEPVPNPMAPTVAVGQDSPSLTTEA